MAVATTTLYCGVLGDGTDVCVDISIDKTVGDLRLAIARILFDDPVKGAHTLILNFPTNLHHGDERLIAGTDLDALLKGSVVPSDGFRKLHSMWRLDDSKHCFGATFPAAGSQIHVLIERLGEQRPAKRVCDSVGLETPPPTNKQFAWYP